MTPLTGEQMKCTGALNRITFSHWGLTLSETFGIMYIINNKTQRNIHIGLVVFRHFKEEMLHITPLRAINVFKEQFDECNSMIPIKSYLWMPLASASVTSHQ